MHDPKEALVGELVDDEHRYDIEQLCRVCGVASSAVIEMVEHGVLEVEGGAPARWRFSNRMLVRFRAAHRLRRDLQINLPGVALCLDLLDELESLRREVSVLRRRDSFRSER